MEESSKPAAIVASAVPARTVTSIYPEPFASRMNGRQKRALGDYFGLRNFGVNLTRMTPGGTSALRHAHSHQDELIYVLEGHPTLVTNAGEIRLAPGMCTGFPAGTGDAHQLVNRTNEEVVYLEIGDRSTGDRVVYPDDDIEASTRADGTRCFVHKDGTPY